MQTAAAADMSELLVSIWQYGWAEQVIHSKAVDTVAVRKRLGDILKDRGLISHEQLGEALEHQSVTGLKLGEALVDLGYVSAEEIADALSEHLDIPRAHLSRRYIQSETLELIPSDMLETNEILPIEKTDDLLYLAMTDPLNILLIDDLQRVTNLRIMPVIATPNEIREAIQRTTDFASTAKRVVAEFRDDSEEVSRREKEKDDADEFVGDAPGVRLSNLILTQAARQKASDIHLEPRKGDLKVRFRIDGVLQNAMDIPKRFINDVTSRLKIMAGMDITERRRPQDGRIKTTIDSLALDMRVSTLPTVYGEKIVARLLGGSTSVLDLDAFGFSPSSIDKVQRMLRQSQGLLLVTGPTGSGKTTSLYGFLQILNKPGHNIITIEDPVEYELDGINQVPVNAKVGLTFSTGLRTVLRQDPDIVMVGEVRDQETADIAVRAALTGHLVLSTLHTNNSAATIARLLDMGVEPYLLSSTLVGIVAQRLVRLICTQCKEEIAFDDPLMERFILGLGMTVPSHVYHGRGCPVCKDTGYRGRAAVEEVLLVNKGIRTAINDGRSEDEIEQLAVDGGMVTLACRAVEQLVDGKTTIAEVIRTVYSVEDEEVSEYVSPSAVKPTAENSSQ